MRAVDRAKSREFLHSQLTIARWYIDRALDSRGEVRRRYRSLARETCEIIERLSPALNLDVVTRHEATRQLILLRTTVRRLGEASDPATPARGSSPASGRGGP
jgi:hypothetical protein